MKNSLNLMSEQSRKRNQVRRCLRIWSKVFATVLVLLALGGAVQWRAYSQVLARHTSAEAAHEPIVKLKTENRRLRKQITDLEAAEAVPLKFSEQLPLLGLIGMTTQAVASQQERVFLKQVEIERDPLAQEPTSEPALMVAIEGISQDKSSAQELTELLRTEGPFSGVEMKTYALPSGNGGESNLAFTIQCKN